MNEDKQSIKPGKNIFLLDGPIGRFELVKVIAIVIGIGLLIGIANTIIVLLFGTTKYTIQASNIILIFYLVLAFYMFFVSYAKRLYDIIGIKNKAIFYTVIIFISKITLPYIPFLKITGIILNIAILAVLLLLPGKYILSKQKEKTDEKV